MYQPQLPGVEMFWYYKLIVSVCYYLFVWLFVIFLYIFMQLYNDIVYRKFFGLTISISILTEFSQGIHQKLFIEV
jgi:hypothetical protein